VVRDDLTADHALPGGGARALALERELGQHRRSAGDGDVARSRREHEHAHNSRGDIASERPRARPLGVAAHVEIESNV